MAEAAFVQIGESLDYTPGADVTAGDVVIQENIVGVAKSDIDSGDLGSLAISGVFDVVKAEEAFATVGANVYWDADGNPYGGTAGAGAATATPTGNTWMGFVLVAAESTDSTVRILLRSTVSLTAEEFSLADLSDIGTVDYTAGDILVADGDSYEDVPLSGPFTLSSAGALRIAVATVAATGSDQTDAAAVAEGFTFVNSVDSGEGVILPTAAAGKICIIKNADVSDEVLSVYPNTLDKINALTATTGSLDMAAKTSVILIALDDTTWYSIPLLPS